MTEIMGHFVNWSSKLDQADSIDLLAVINPRLNFWTGTALQHMTRVRFSNKSHYTWNWSKYAEYAIFVPNQGIQPTNLLQEVSNFIQIFA